jgi:hypothetical protein
MKIKIVLGIACIVASLIATQSCKKITVAKQILVLQEETKATTWDKIV